ncbi:MAG: 2-oxoacid:acceptor oxidoreductase subunit alpha [candidate division WOR-3 bacterium]|nr:2-oxoacid:acceptor oxidoreductase subunit alpha [candidate division WOR-3 bacterium]MCX7948272.1 2-oxoacid:acceptor oxidoreductase subunit alpha [candidate division WOR-3 bacterium]MDW8150951.1 2-oxoacid:acceptor oxidoreductase subunit alpha [candidate division WOR-3 bacterium]
MIKNDITIRVAGRAGDGSLTTADILSKVFKNLGLWLVTYKDFPSNIRGLPTNITLRANEKRIYYGRKDKLDYLLAFDRKNVELHIDDVIENGVIIYDNSNEELTGELIRKDIYYYYIPLQSIAKNQLGLEVIKNIISVGAIVYLLGIDYERAKNIIYEHFLKTKGQKIADKNLEAFNVGYNYAKENIKKQDNYIVEEVEEKIRTYFIMGNEALAFGAIAGGCRFYASYPITPASEVLEILSEELPKYGGVVVQAEDEIASINFALGAGYAGVRAMTGTSGPGMSLKTETLGLAVMNETPIVIYLSQRAGPSTGLPTKVEQSDIYHAIFGGHGDAPRIVIAPGNVKEMFEFAIIAFNLAEKYQTPVILLADQVLAQNKYTIPIEEINIKDIKIERGKALTQEELNEMISRGEKYLRYKITQDGISPRTIPGMEGGIFTANSNEHEEDGYTTEDPKKRSQMLEKRIRKIYQTARNSNDLPEDLIFGEGDVGLIGFGFTYGPIMESMERLEKENIKVKFLQIRTLWPLDKEKINSFIDSCYKVIVVEQNAQGQFSNVIKMNYSNHEKIESLRKYDGRGFTPGDIVEKVKEVILQEAKEV